MKITKHTGWGIRRETELLLDRDINAGTVYRNNLGEWGMRLVASDLGDPKDYTAYWITFTDEEAKELRKAINFLLKISKPERA